MESAVAEPTRKYSDVEVKYLTLLCDDDSAILIHDSTIVAINKHKLICSQCGKEFLTTDRPGIVYLAKK